MRLFGKVDGSVDRLDRAGWMTLPFDLAFSLHIANYEQVPTNASIMMAVKTRSAITTSVGTGVRMSPLVKTRVEVGSN